MPEIFESEESILQVAQSLKDSKKSQDLAILIKECRPYLKNLNKAKAAKLIRRLVDMFLEMNADSGLEISLCQFCIDWAKEEKRTFLRQSLEAKLIELFYKTKKYQEALQLNFTLLKELKKMDDKQLLVEVQLLESKTYHALSNLPKAKAALTSARTTANAIYCPPLTQASLDLQSGILHAAEERDFKTAFSYFYEAFEGFDSAGSPKAIKALKYMLLSKIMLNQAEEVNKITLGKLAMNYAGNDIDALKAIAEASHKRSLSDFQEALEKYKKELSEDRIIRAHFNTLYDNMLQQNLCRIIEPFSTVQVEHIAKVINLSKEQVETKLSQMILDKKFSGILDQGAGVLIIFDETELDKTYETSLSTIQHFSKVVDSLYQKAKKIS